MIYCVLCVECFRMAQQYTLLFMPGALVSELMTINLCLFVCLIV